MHIQDDQLEVMAPTVTSVTPHHPREGNLLVARDTVWQKDCNSCEERRLLTITERHGFQFWPLPPRVCPSRHLADADHLWDAA